jgi:hypothetical protein
MHSLKEGLPFSLPPPLRVEVSYVPMRKKINTFTREQTLPHPLPIPGAKNGK